MANEEIIGSSSVGATERPFKFEGNHFKRWQQKMFFFLTLKKCAYVLKDPIPVVPDVPTDASASGTKEQPVNTNGQTVSAAEPDKGKATAEQLKEKALQVEKERQLWIDNDYICKNYIINGLEDDLYDYYRTYETASDVWEALSKKYDTEEAGAKKYAVSRYLKYQMVDERSVEVQSHELQKIAHEIITEAYVRKPDPKRVKLASRAYECVFIGYAANSKAYRFYDLNEKVIIESNDADFYENKFPIKSRNSGGTEQDNIPESSHVPVIPNADGNDEVETELRRSKRVRVAKDYGPDYAAYTLNEDPANLQEALSSMDANLWQEAINDEMDSLESNKTWHLVDLPPGCKPIGCKWILKKKLKPDGTVEKYKARLIAKGFRQRENIDFFDTFSPVTRITSIRVLISIAALYNLIVYQMDVNTAFLNGDLEEEIYMEQPEGFVIHGQETKVCKLDKSLYGLKQAPKQWHEKFDNLMVSNGFRLNESDKCIYYKCDGNICTIICLYVDDMLIFGSNLSAVNNVKSLLGNNFDMKDLGEASVILGIKTTRSEKGISLDQSHYVEKILKKYGYYDCKPAYTPYDPSVKLFKNTGDSVRQQNMRASLVVLGMPLIVLDPTSPMS
ncbi:hypothetical protein TSUD_113030 [Trifolium subterraneum]|uniref:Uncharacterized protein n=1 Tax=Trifolium subterraneum TaxID=3900 RepID=A0A2Z6LG16_TRISU|nr:hypothetical protein TSUD_113030 [Trifolium subterraneum]